MKKAKEERERIAMGSPVIATKPAELDPPKPTVQEVPTKEQAQPTSINQAVPQPEKEDTKISDVETQPVQKTASGESADAVKLNANVHQSVLSDYDPFNNQVR